jgi:AraC family transcriptional regulator, transcriptional activator of pobA
MLGRRDDGLAIYTYEAVPGVPAVSTIKFGQKLPPDGPPPRHAHSHDFLVLAYFERGGGSMWLGDREWQIQPGDVYLIAPGEVVGVGDDASSLHEVEGWAVFFLPEVLGPRAPGAFLSWRAHPLLFPFVRGAAGGAGRLKVPPAERPSWSERFLALDLELSKRHDGYREAVLAHLTLLLVGVSRLAVEEVGRRVGYVDAGYFVRTFRRTHGITPLGWRRAGRPGGPAAWRRLERL